MVQRGVDTAAEWSCSWPKLMPQPIRAAKLLRKRRWALRLALFLLRVRVFWVGVTGPLAVVEHAGMGTGHPRTDCRRRRVPGHVGVFCATTAAG